LNAPSAQVERFPGVSLWRPIVHGAVLAHAGSRMESLLIRWVIWPLTENIWISFMATDRGLAFFL
jgi:hypothetical protein